MVQGADIARGYIGAATDTSSVAAHSAGGGRGTLVYQSDTTPVNGTGGTYAGLAPAGALLVAPDGDDEWTLYQNTGTQASPTWTEKAASGGGSGPILVADAQLTDAQFKALPSGPFTLLAAPAAGFMYLVRDWIAVLDTRGGVGYGNIGGYVYFTVNADLKRVRYLDSIQWPDLLTNVLPRSGVELSVLGPIPSTDTSFLTAGGVGVVGGPVTFQLDNVDNVDDYNSVGPFTGGHADNNFSVRVWYSLVPTAPFGA